MATMTATRTMALYSVLTLRGFCTLAKLFLNLSLLFLWNVPKLGIETWTARKATSLKYHTIIKNGRTFVLHQKLQLIFNIFIPLGDVYMQRVITAGFLVCGLLPALKRLQQTVTRLRGDVVNWKLGRAQGIEKRKSVISILYYTVADTCCLCLSIHTHWSWWCPQQVQPWCPERSHQQAVCPDRTSSGRC